MFRPPPKHSMGGCAQVTLGCLPASRPGVRETALVLGGPQLFPGPSELCSSAPHPGLPCPAGTEVGTSVHIPSSSCRNTHVLTAPGFHLCLPCPVHTWLFPVPEPQLSARSWERPSPNALRTRAWSLPPAPNPENATHPDHHLRPIIHSLSVSSS